MTHHDGDKSVDDRSKAILPSRFLNLLMMTGVFVGSAAMVATGSATHGISTIIFAFIDMPGFLVVFGCAALLAGLVAVKPLRGSMIPATISAFSPASIAGVTLVISVLGVHVVYHDYALSMDEWMTRLQSEIFLAGQVTAHVPEQWRAFGFSMYDNFAKFDPITGALATDYRPGMSALHALFDLVGLGSYTSAVMNALAVLLVARVARQIFPEHNEAPIVAALLLATSQQALAASFTSYAMSAHLCFNLLWLTLFLQDRWRSHVLAACVGIATAGLHQIHMHLFFALPFLLCLLRPFRPGLILLYGAFYALGHWAISIWDWVSFYSEVTAASQTAQPAVSSQQAGQPIAETETVISLWDRIRTLIRLPGAFEFATVGANISRLIAWQSLALLPLILVGSGAVMRHRTMALLAGSVAFSVLPYLLLMPDQGHGWGYRYLHGLLGNLALLAIPGWLLLRAHLATSPFARWVIACLLVSPLVMIPFRAFQIEGWVGSYADATALIAQQDADVVIVANYDVLIGRDITRNAPIRPSRPIMMNEEHLSPSQITLLCNKYRVAFAGPAFLEQAGIRLQRDVDPEYANAFARRRAAIKACGL